MSDRSINRVSGLPPGNPLIAVRSGAWSPAGRRRARMWLLLAAGLWGVSFPLAKSLLLAQQALLPHADSLFFAGTALTVRFGLAALLLAGFARAGGRRVTRLELSQGVGLGLCAAGGMLLQLDGQAYTSASTSAFLTSCYCVIIPVIVACQRRRLPPGSVLGSMALAFVGLTLLAGINWHTLRLGRGETETLVCSLFFAAQIFWLERPVFAANRTAHATMIMFATLAITAAPVMLLKMHSAHDILVAAAGSPAIAFFMATLTLLCTVVTFSLMNHWQRFVEATEAGLIYCAEPVFASVFALFLPMWLARCCGVPYANETLTARLLLGGALITAANICIQLRPRAVTPVR